MKKHGFMRSGDWRLMLIPSLKGPLEEEHYDTYEEAIEVLNKANGAKVEGKVEEEASSPRKKMAKGELLAEEDDARPKHA